MNLYSMLLLTSGLQAHRSRLRRTARTEVGRLISWMTLPVAVLIRNSLRGVKVGCSPAPTYAIKLVQNSISAILQAGKPNEVFVLSLLTGLKAVSLSSSIRLGPDCAKIRLVKNFVCLQAIDFDTLVIGYRYACVVLIESQVQDAFGRWRFMQRHINW